MDLIHVTGWGAAPSRPLSGHFRTRSSVAAPTISSATTDSPPPSPLSGVHGSSGKPRVPTKAPSTSALPTIRHSASQVFYDDEMSTIPDPRSRTRSPSRQGSTASSHTNLNANPVHHPDLTDEVATLSTKLINAINHSTVLDDTLSQTRHDLEAANQRIRTLEEQNASQREMLAGDVWIRRSAADVDKKVLHQRIADEKARTADVERAKKKIEQELENLTTALFEEANKMVIRAKEEAQAEHDAIQRRNDQLRAQLRDSESLLQSQQDQLAELKHVMEAMTADREDAAAAQQPTAPSSPRGPGAAGMGGGLPASDARDDARSLLHGAPSSGPLEPVAPAHPTSFQHLLQPVLRVDLSSYDDFIQLASLSRGTAGSNRVSSGSMGGINLASLGLGGSTSSNHHHHGSSSSAAATAASSAPQSPTPAAAGSPPATAVAATTNLKDTRFYKRVLVEDIEPTLRLDVAPGLSWLARRSVVGAVTDGSLVVDPVSVHPGNQYMMNLIKPQYHPCSLCGEARKDPPYLRLHRFRTSEQETAQRYPLCPYCLGRVRSTCDFLSFLRMLKDGHWRADDEDQEKAAWEESVRLREQMFWARVGGGVVPCVHHAPADVRAESPAQVARTEQGEEEKEGEEPKQEPAREETLEEEEQFHDPPTGTEPGRDNHQTTTDDEPQQEPQQQPQTPPTRTSTSVEEARPLPATTG